MAVALGLALRAPLAVVVVGILVVGMPHVLFELRHVLGRYAPLLTGRFLLVLNAVLVAIVAERALLPAGVGRRLELVAALVLLAAALTRAPRSMRLPGGVAIALIGVAAWVHADQWFLVVAHLHNVIPVIFLWEWATSQPAARRRTIRATATVLLLVVPLAIAVGFADSWLALGLGPTDAATATGVIASVVPGGTSEQWTVRLLAAFAFAQLMHYAVWCWFLPRHARPDAARFAASPVGHAVRGRRLLVLAVAGSVAITALAIVDYRQGRSLYTALASYHAYLELPILVLLLTTMGGRPDRARPTPTRPAPTRPAQLQGSPL